MCSNTRAQWWQSHAILIENKRTGISIFYRFVMGEYKKKIINKLNDIIVFVICHSAMDTVCPWSIVRKRISRGRSYYIITIINNNKIHTYFFLSASGTAAERGMQSYRSAVYYYYSILGCAHALVNNTFQ